MEKGLANFLSHVILLACHVLLPETLPPWGVWTMVMPLGFPHPNASAGAGNGPSPGGAWQPGSVPGAAPELGILEM